MSSLSRQALIQSRSAGAVLRVDRSIPCSVAVFRISLCARAFRHHAGANHAARLRFGPGHPSGGACFCWVETSGRRTRTPDKRHACWRAQSRASRERALRRCLQAATSVPAKMALTLSTCSIGNRRPCQKQSKSCGGTAQHSVFRRCKRVGATCTGPTSVNSAGGGAGGPAAAAAGAGGPAAAAAAAAAPLAAPAAPGESGAWSRSLQHHGMNVSPVARGCIHCADRSHLLPVASGCVSCANRRIRSNTPVLPSHLTSPFTRG